MSRTNARSRGLRRRPSRTIPAVVVAIVLLAIGIAVAIAAITRLSDGTWPSPVAQAASSVAALTWDSSASLIGAGCLVVLGLVLLTAGLKRGALRTARLASSTQDSTADRTDFVISTRAMAHLAAAGADRIDGVDKVSASASGRRVRLKVTTTSERTDEIRSRVTQRVTETFTVAGLDPVPRVTATVRTKGI